MSSRVEKCVYHVVIDHQSVVCMPDGTSLSLLEWSKSAKSKVQSPEFSGVQENSGVEELGRRSRKIGRPTTDPNPTC